MVFQKANLTTLEFWYSSDKTGTVACFTSTFSQYRSSSLYPWEQVGFTLAWVNINTKTPV